ncbi:complexed with cef1p [Dimargaris xerosporica]|nr:complexed with cef1p [Dimargaris xerosporica]
MTTAARPTFDPAKGRKNQGPTLLVSSRDLPSHTQLKYRQTEPLEGEELEVFTLKQRLLEAERAHFEKRKAEKEAQGSGPTEESADTLPQPLDEAKKQLLLDQVKGWDEDESSAEESEGDDENDSEGNRALRHPQSKGNESSDESSDEESDDEDETAQLLRELEKIKRERAEEEQRKEEQRQQLEAAHRSEQLLAGNPLLNLGGDQSFAVKRRWDDDVIFKNQARDVDDKPQKRFINDMLRSDFHRKFMNKYIR